MNSYCSKEDFIQLAYLLRKDTVIILVYLVQRNTKQSQFSVFLCIIKGGL